MDETLIFLHALHISGKLFHKNSSATYTFTCITSICSANWTASSVEGVYCATDILFENNFADFVDEGQVKKIIQILSSH